jgi:hypothetical protein
VTGVRRFRARLDRISKLLAAGSSKNRGVFFPIDAGVARQIRGDLERLNALKMVQLPYGKDHRPLTFAEEEEMATLHERMRANIATIDRPAGYGLTESREDEQRLRGMSYVGPRDEAEDNVQALLIARVSAFWATPEGQARSRIAYLQHRSRPIKFVGPRQELPPSEAKELEDLEARYPDVPTRFQTLMAERMKPAVEAWKKSLTDMEERERQERLERKKRQES